jgi:hypothetical protein
MSATDRQIRDLAGTIARQAQAIADGTTGATPVYGVVRLLRNNVDTLMAWVPDDRT